MVMRLIWVAIFAFGFLVWHIRRNDGHYTHQIIASIDEIKREVRWR